MEDVEAFARARPRLDRSDLQQPPALAPEACCRACNDLEPRLESRTSSILLPEEPTPRKASQTQQPRTKQYNRGRLRHGRRRRSPSEVH